MDALLEDDFACLWAVKLFLTCAGWQKTLRTITNEPIEMVHQRFWVQLCVFLSSASPQLYLLQSQTMEGRSRSPVLRPDTHVNKLVKAYEPFLFLHFFFSPALTENTSDDISFVSL